MGSDINETKDDTHMSTGMDGTTCGILVVDDDDSIRESVQMALESFGYNVFNASSGFEAVSSLRKHIDEIHVALVDFVMPDRDGEAVTKDLLKVKPMLPVVIFSGIDIKDMKFEIRSIGAKDYLAKPYKISDMMELITLLVNEGTTRNRKKR